MVSALPTLSQERELQRILLLDLVLPGCVLSPCPFSSELLVLDGCTGAAAMILFSLLLVRFPDLSGEATSKLPQHWYRTPDQGTHRFMFLL